MRRNRYMAAAAVSALLGIVAGAAQAQIVSPLTPGDTIRGALIESDTSPDADIGDDYRLTLRAGQRIEAVLRTEAFDAYLEIYAEGDAQVPLASDDDGLGDGTDARLRFTAPEAGVYVLRARSLGGDEIGDYTLEVTERAPPPPAGRPQAVRLGSTTEGRLDAASPEDDEGRGYSDFSVRLARDQRLSIRLNAEDFDPLVRVGRVERGVFQELAANDDGDDGLNSHLVFTAPERGAFVIRATSFSGGEGDFSLILAQPPAPAELRALPWGEAQQGRLGTDSGVNASDQRADVFRFSGREGQRVRLTLTSPDFDAYLELFRETETGQRESLASDDDGLGQGTDSRLIHELPADGSYVVEARAFGGGGEGTYALTLDELPPPPEPQAIAFGQTVQGEITDDGAVDDNGRPYVAYRFAAENGQRVRAVMRSGDFDAYLELGEAGETYTVLASDDDGLGEGTDAQLSHTVAADGDYIIRALPLGGGSKGLFSLELIDRGPQPAPGSVLVGATVRGMLSDDDTLTDEGALTDLYRLQAKAGEKLRLIMVSNDFDAFIEIGRDGDSFSRMAFDDDGLSDTHAQLDWEAPEDGVYLIRARSYAANQTGAYALSVERRP